MKKEFVRNPYNYDSDETSNDTGLACKDESRTEQQHLEESDINYIADKFMRTGELKQVVNLPTMGDFEGIFDFQTAMNTIVAAKQEFMKLPPKLRSRFENDPAQLIAFLNDDANREEAEFLGLVPKRAKLDAPTTGDENDTRNSSRTEDDEKASTRGPRPESTTREDAPTQKPRSKNPQGDRG